MRQAGGLVVGLAIAAAAAACGGNTGTQGVGTSGSRDGNGPTVTVTGCVQPGDPVGTYVLTDTRTETTEGSSRPGGSAAATGPGGAGSIGNDRAFAGATQTYRLIDDANVDFGSQVHKQVRVTGQVATLPDTSAPAGTTGGQAPPDAQPPPAGTTGGAGNPAGNQGSGNVGQGIESRSNQGSGGGRVLGGSSDRAASPQFLRVTSLTKLADRCGGK